MGMPVWLKDTIKWLAAAFGKDVMIAAKDKLQDMWKRAFASRNILILGSRQSGKTALLFLLQYGKPYKVVDGEVRTPNPTAMAAVVDKKFSLHHGNWLRLKRDVPGDPDLRETWAQAITDLRPQGIIYMLDGRLEGKKLRSELTAIRESVLVHYESSLGDLQTLHVFLNFADHWAASPSVQRAKIRVVTEALEDALSGSSALQHLRIDVAVTHLSPHEKTWSGASRALHKFGADLMA